MGRSLVAGNDFIKQRSNGINYTLCNYAHNNLTPVLFLNFCLFINLLLFLNNRPLPATPCSKREHIS